ncbi:helix-turn-helix domain-containing protein [Streptacidiphilus pinicola]|uniref:helix-turn-helix domain-containing protein n=1 Tax=Streptacidiphilus pinicola TaxID=2219663 RepID=UPI001403FBE2|nr:helix-turn-helix domain-containing protein [Streptacidiphilus pinicola]
MARWKALPEGLDPAVVRFVAELRRLKDETGLSVVQVADRTGYSEASWQRYFGGRTLAPREAVERLVEIAGADGATVAALQDAAQQVWRPAASAAATDDTVALEEVAPAGPEPALPESAPAVVSMPVGASDARPALDTRTVLTAVVSALVGAAVTLLLVQPWNGSTSAAAAAPVARPTPKAPVSYHCAYRQTGGKWYAGNSATNTDLVIDGEAGPEVAEVQCLLEHAGISAGAVDGAFGPMTLHAVILEQEARHIDIDGQVGPQTWAALRG